MRVSKNRQSGFIKNSSSLNNVQSLYQPHYQMKENESFQKFEDEFSSFCYKQPQEESQNQFSLFVFNQKQKRQEASKNNKKTTDIDSVKQNDYKLGNKMRSDQIQQDEKVLQEDKLQSQGNMGQTHIKYNKKKPDPIRRKTTNYYSATTTTYTNKNKMGADNNNQKRKPTISYNNQQLCKHEMRQNYISQQSTNSPRAHQYKEVGKLIKTSKEHSTERCSIQFSKKYQEDMYENGQQYYKERQLHYQRTGFNSLKRIKSDENLFHIKNFQTQQYAPKSFTKKVSKKQYKIHNQMSPYYPSSPRIVSNKNISYQEPQLIIRNYKEVSQSSVVESEPSFLKERLEEVQRRKLQLLSKKRQLQELKTKSRQIIQQKYSHTNHSIQAKKKPQINHSKTINYTSQQRQTKNKKSNQQRVQEVSLPNSSSDQQSSSQSSEKTSSQNDQSNNSQRFSDSQNQKPQNHKFSLKNPSQSQNQIRYQNYQKQIHMNRQTHYQPSSQSLQNLPKSIKNLNISQTTNNLNINFINANKTSSIHRKSMKTTPLKIINQIEKRSEQLKRQQLKQMYEKEGISVAKGGVSFDINTKDFIYPEIETDPHNPNSSPSQNDLHKYTTASKESTKYNLKKNQSKINSKQQLKRRRELAKSYDRYSRNRIFGDR